MSNASTSVYYRAVAETLLLIQRHLRAERITQQEAKTLTNRVLATPCLSDIVSIRKELNNE